MNRACVIMLAWLACEPVYEVSPYAVDEDTEVDTTVDTLEDTADTDEPDTDDSDQPDSDTAESDPPDSDPPETDPPDTDPPDSDPPDTSDSDTDDSAVVDTDTDTDTDVPVPPFVLTDQYVMSGYMGAGSIAEGTCTQRGGQGRGTCIEVQWGGSLAGWGGAYFQYPANNWGMSMGYLIPQGYTQVSLWAWGAAGGENVEFKAGIDSADGFEISGGEQTLTTTPQRFTIDLMSTPYVHVAGGLAWFAIGTDPITFYLDDIVYE